MIERLPDMPEKVIGIRVSGRLGGDELRDFKPEIDQVLQTGEVRIVEVIASDYEGFGPGGFVEDLKLGFGTVPACTIRRSSGSRWSPAARTGSPLFCTSWRGWSPVRSPCSGLTSLTAPRSGRPTEGRLLNSVEKCGGLDLHENVGFRPGPRRPPTTNSRILSGVQSTR